MIVTVQLPWMQGQVVVREAMASAMVLLWAAAVLPSVPCLAAAQQMVLGALLRGRGFASACQLPVSPRAPYSPHHACLPLPPPAQPVMHSVLYPPTPQGPQHPRGSTITMHDQPTTAMHVRRCCTEQRQPQLQCRTPGGAAGIMVEAQEAPCLVAVEGGAGGVVEAALRQEGSSLVAELRRFSQAGRVCGLKGLLTALPFEALTASFQWLPPGGGTAACSAWRRCAYELQAAATVLQCCGLWLHATAENLAMYVQPLCCCWCWHPAETKFQPCWWQHCVGHVTCLSDLAP
jgi:hypothetical protein